MRTIHKMYTDNICVTYYACGVIDNTPPKITSHDILMLGLEGEMEITIDNSHPLKIGTSNMLFIPKGSKYSVNILQPALDYPWIGYFVVFDLSIPMYQLDLADILQFPNRISLQGEDIHHCIRAFQNILECHDDGTLIGELKCKAYTLELFCSFLKTYGDPTQIENYDKRLLDLVSYIGINYGDASITLESLALLANMHSSSLIRLFKEQTGVTPMQFVNRTRLMAAKRMLLYSNKSIKEIALETGFGEQQSFVRSLRQDTGLTPSDFRRVMGCEEPEE